MSAVTNSTLIFDLIKQQYRPYDAHKEFGRGLQPTRPAISAIHTRPIAFPLRRGTWGSKLRCA